MPEIQHQRQSSVKTKRPATHRPAAGMKFNGHFLTAEADPYQQVKWTKRSSQISSSEGETIFEMSNLEFPEEWSQLAVDIAVSKYFRRAGVPGTGHEVSLRQLVHRIVHTIRVGGEAEGYFASAQDAEMFEKELSYVLLTQRAAFNSPVWFNLGLYHEYGITGGGGHYHWDKEVGAPVTTKTSYEHPQCSACFIQSVKDDLMGIFDLVKQEAKIFKYGSGSGSNFSSVRGRQEKLSGGGSSSGLMSFLAVFDRAAGATKSGGTTRRAAKMVCLDMDHPEIEDFITWKAREEKKIRALISAGYASDFNGEAYATVSGQNSNNSVRVTDEFMQAVADDADWHLRARTNGEVIATVKAKDLWNKVAEAAWNCADPGVQFDSEIQRWHTCANSGRINASNPCSEFMFLDDTACNLASINLTKYLRSDGSFAIEDFRHTVRLLLTAQDILVDLSSYPVEGISRNSHLFRPLGLGYANLGSAMMVKGMAYDSDEARAWAAEVTSLMQAEAYRTSAELASKVGPFEGFSLNREPMMMVVRKHAKAAEKLTHTSVDAKLHKAGLHLWKEAVEEGEKHGYRNSQVSALAPTGTIGLLMDCDTTGVEPDFSLVKYKKLAGGGYFKIVNQSVPLALSRLGYGAEQIKEIEAYILETNGYEGAPHLKEEHLAIFDCANKCGDKGTRYIAPMGHVRMMAAVQPFISGAISKTVNLPSETTVEEIADVYFQAWKLGLKAIAIYRDGSKASQPLTTTETKADKAGGEKVYTEEQLREAIDRAVELAPSRRRKLPKRRTGTTIESNVSGHKIFLRTGEYDDGRLGEIFIDMHKEGAAFRSLLNCFAISVSMGLQYGVPIEEYVQKFTFTRFEPYGTVDHPNIKMATSIIDYVFRVLALEYLGRTDLVHVKPKENEGEEKSPVAQMSLPVDKMVMPPAPQASSLSEHLSDMMGDAPPCNDCGHITVRNGACYRCLNCGASMGCS